MTHENKNFFDQKQNGPMDINARFEETKANQKSH